MVSKRLEIAWSMELSALLTLFDQEQRIGIEYPDMRKDVLPDVVRFVRPAPGMSTVLYSCLNLDNADAAIEAQIEYFDALGQNFTWKVHEHDHPSNLQQRLLVRGFEPDDDPAAIMVLDLQAAPLALLEPGTAVIRPITHRDQLSDVIAILEQVWGGSFAWVTERLGSHLDVPDYLSVYVAYVDEQPACVGWTYFHPHSQFASLWAGSTVPEYRQRGLYTAVLATRVQEARQRGRRFLTIDANRNSQPIVARHGFQLLTRVYACDWNGE